MRWSALACRRGHGGTRVMPLPAAGSSSGGRRRKGRGEGAGGALCAAVALALLLLSLSSSMTTTGVDAFRIPSALPLGGGGARGGSGIGGGSSYDVSSSSSSLSSSSSFLGPARPRSRRRALSPPLAVAAVAPPTTEAAASSAARGGGGGGGSGGGGGGGADLTAALDDLAARGRYQEALALLRTAREREGTATTANGPGVGPVHYHKVILSCKPGRQWALALDLLREMRSVPGMQVMLHTYGTAMDICASAGQLDHALQVAAWMEEAGLALNKVAYTTLIKACAEARQGHRALEVLERLHASPVTLDYLGYLKVIELLGSSGLLDDAMRELSVMSATEAIVADHRAYFSLVRNALARKRVDLAARSLAMMAEVGCAPQAAGMKLLWDSVIKSGHAREGLALLDSLHHGAAGGEMTMSPLAYHNTRLRLLLSAGDKEGAMGELHEMARRSLHINDARAVNLGLRVFTNTHPHPAHPSKANRDRSRPGNPGPAERNHSPSSMDEEEEEAEAEGVLALVAALRGARARLDVVHYTTAINAVGKAPAPAPASASSGGKVAAAGGKGGGRGAARARTLLGWMDEDGVRPNDVTYTSLIHIFGQAGDLPAASALLEQRMPADGVAPSTITVCALLNAYWKAGQGSLAVEKFEALGQQGLPRDARVYATVMQTLLSLGRAAEVPAYLERMAGEGIRPDSRIYAILAKTKFLEKDWKAALRLVKEADAEGVVLDGRFFTVLLDGLAQGGHAGKAWEAFRSMKARGIPPNPFHYAALLKVFTIDQAGGSSGSSGGSGEASGAATDPERLNEYIRTFDAAIQEDGLRPSIINYNALIEACGRVKDARAALGFFDRLKAAGFAPDVISWSVLIKAHAHAGNFTGAFSLLDEMIREGRVPPSDRTFNPLIDRCARAGRMDLVDRALATMQSLPRPVSPDVITYNSILSGRLSRGETADAEALLARMQQGQAGAAAAGGGGGAGHVSASQPPGAGVVGVRPNVVTYNILVDHFSRAGLWERAFGAVERMKEAGLAPDTQTYNHLLDGLARSGQLPRAEETLVQMRAAGLRPDGFTATVMLGVYGKEGDLAKLDAFVELLREEKVEQTPAVVATLVKTYLQHKQPERAASLLEARRLDGLPVARVQYSYITGHFFDEGRSEEGFRYLDDLSSKGIRLDGRSYAALARGLLAKGQATVAAELVFGDMRRRGVALCKDLAPVVVAVARAVVDREAEGKGMLGEMVAAGVVTQEAADGLWAGRGMEGGALSSSLDGRPIGGGGGGNKGRKGGGGGGEGSSRRPKRIIPAPV